MWWFVGGLILGFCIVAAYMASVWACRKELRQMGQSVTYNTPPDVVITLNGGIYDVVDRGDLDA